MRLAIVSPHRDDAAFSCTITIAALGRFGVDVTVINLFTISDYAPYSNATRSEDISEIRRLEDAEFLKRPGITAALVDLSMEDAPIRFRLPTHQVLENPLDNHTVELDVVTVCSRLRTALNAGVDFDAILLPLALGNHIDHRIARDAGLRAFRHKPVAFYEDLPYACQAPREAVQLEVDRLRSLLAGRLFAYTISVAEGAELKYRCARVYKSQIGTEVATAIRDYATGKQDGECLWVTTKWLAWMSHPTLRRASELITAGAGRKLVEMHAVESLRDDEPL